MKHTIQDYFAHPFIYNSFIIIVFSCTYLLIRRFLSSWVHRLGEIKKVDEARIKFISRSLNGLLLFAVFSLAAVSIGLGYTEVSLFFSSAFAVLGVALFAQWSMLSNITASVLIFFAFPYRIGDHVKVVDKDEDITGTIRNIAMFHVLIERVDGSVVAYPNNIILQKAVIRLTALPSPVKEDKKEEKESIMDDVTSNI